MVANCGWHGAWQKLLMDGVRRAMPPMCINPWATVAKPPSLGNWFYFYSAVRASLKVAGETCQDSAVVVVMNCNPIDFEALSNSTKTCLWIIMPTLIKPSSSNGVLKQEAFKGEVGGVHACSMISALEKKPIKTAKRNGAVMGCYYVWLGPYRYSVDWYINKCVWHYCWTSQCVIMKPIRILGTIHLQGLGPGSGWVRAFLDTPTCCPSRTLTFTDSLYLSASHLFVLIANLSQCHVNMKGIHSNKHYAHDTVCKIQNSILNKSKVKR